MQAWLAEDSILTIRDSGPISKSDSEIWNLKPEFIYPCNLLFNVAGLTNLKHAFADQIGGRVRSPMLIPSILQILDQAQAQTKIVEKAESGFQAELTAANRKLSALETVETEMADAADPAKPQDPNLQNQTAPLKRFGLSELLRTITKFEESKQSRVVDFFE